MADVLLTGPPDGVTGQVPFENTTSSAVTITEVGVEDPDDPTTSAVVAVDEVTAQPGQRVLLRLGLRVSPLTPPGSHALTLTVGGTTIEATAEVVEAPDLRVTPQALVLDGLVDGHVTATVVVANEGNVALSVPAALSLPVHAEDRALPTLAALTRDRPDDLDRVVPLPDDAVGTLDVAIDPPGGVEPGTTRVCTCTFSLPDDLPASARHVAGLPLSVRTVLVVIPAPGTQT